MQYFIMDVFAHSVLDKLQVGVLGFLFLKATSAYPPWGHNFWPPQITRLLILAPLVPFQKDYFFCLH